MKTKRRRCPHLEDKTLAKHSTMTLVSVPDDQNTTSYRGIREELELCVFCSGYMLGVIRREPFARQPDDEEQG
jgi:hypothetical protein